MFFNWNGSVKTLDSMKKWEIVPPAHRSHTGEYLDLQEELVNSKLLITLAELKLTKESSDW